MGGVAPMAGVVRRAGKRVNRIMHGNRASDTKTAAAERAAPCKTRKEPRRSPNGRLGASVCARVACHLDTSGVSARLALNGFRSARQRAGDCSAVQQPDGAAAHWRRE